MMMTGVVAVKSTVHSVVAGTGNVNLEPGDGTLAGPGERASLP